MTTAEQHMLFSLYLIVADRQGFQPEVYCPEEINNGNIFDHVAYHVETFGRSIPGYKEIEHLICEGGKAMPKTPEPSGNLTDIGTPTYIFYVTLCQLFQGYYINAEAPSELILARYLNKFYPKIWACIKIEKPVFIFFIEQPDLLWSHPSVVVYNYIFFDFIMKICVS
jgi:hypothetical protein